MSNIVQRSNQAQLVNKPVIDRNDAADLDRSVDDMSDREPLFPLKAFVLEGDLLTVSFEDFYDSKGLKITFRCMRSDIPEMVPGKTYSNIYFTTHPKFAKILLERHAAFRRAFLLCVSGEPDTAAFRPSVVIQNLMAEVGELGIPMRVTREVLGYTRNGKPKIEDSFARLD